MLRSTLLLLVVAISSIAQTRSYSIVMGGRTAGDETLTVNSDGSVAVAYSYNDRGRGPDVRGNYVFDREGMPVLIDLTGQDYNHTPIDEHFAARGGRSQWKSKSEAGESKSGGWYVAANGPASETAWLVRAMLQAKKTSLRLLPGGEATLDRGPTVSVKAQQVTMYRVGGIGFMPVSVWLDEHNELFAKADIIREGFEDSLEKLRAAEAEAASLRLHELAVRLAHKPANGVAIRHVRVFDSGNAVLRENQIVVLSGNRIASVETDSGAPLQNGMESIDGTGKTLLPGLFDMHTHFGSQASGILNIACGVTTIRDLGANMKQLLSGKQQMDANLTIGPRIILAGVVDGRGPFAAPTDVLVDTETEALAAIEKYKAAGYIQIKIYSSVQPKLVPFIVNTAHKNGMRVSGHVPAGMIADQFVDAGADELQHINFFFLNFLPQEAAKTNTRARLTLPAEHAAELDPNSAAVERFIAKLKSKQIVVDPTLGVFEKSYVARTGVASPGMTAIVDRLPAQEARDAFQGGLPVTGDQDRLYRASFQAMMDMTARLYRAGVPLVIGTDGTQGLMLHRELELWVKAGIPTEKVLQIATIGAARVGRVDADRGVIAPGKLADLVLFDGNPVQAISDIRKPEITIKDGLVYRNADLYRAIGMKP